MIKLINDEMWLEANQGEGNAPPCAHCYYPVTNQEFGRMAEVRFAETLILIMFCTLEHAEVWLVEYEEMDTDARGTLFRKMHEGRIRYIGGAASNLECISCLLCDSPLGVAASKGYALELRAVGIIFVLMFCDAEHSATWQKWAEYQKSPEEWGAYFRNGPE